MAPYCFLKSGEKANFNFKKLSINISEKNETKAMHRINYRASNSVNDSISSVAITTMMFQNGRKLTFNRIYFANEFGDPQFF